MVWYPGRLTAAQLEERRLLAEAPRGLAPLRRRPRTGRPPRLSGADWARRLTLLAQGAVAAGFDTERWTLKRIRALVRRELGVTLPLSSLPLSSLSRGLHARGWSPQRPPTQARERDDALVAAWLRHDWPRINKRLVAPGGRWPSWTRADGSPGSPVSGPGRHHLGARGPGAGAAPGEPMARGLEHGRADRAARRDAAPAAGPALPRQHRGRRGDHGAAVLPPALRAAVAHPVGSPRRPHRAPDGRLRRGAPADFQLEWLPGYAPDLKPEEPCNQWVKHDMANALPASIDQLRRVARGRFARLRHRPAVLPSCFDHAGLMLN